MGSECRRQPTRREQDPMAMQLDKAGQQALIRVLEVIEAEGVDATGYLAGFLEGLGEHIAGMVSARALSPS